MGFRQLMKRKAFLTAEV